MRVSRIDLLAASIETEHEGTSQRFPLSALWGAWVWRGARRILFQLPIGDADGATAALRHWVAADDAHKRARAASDTVKDSGQPLKPQDPEATKGVRIVQRREHSVTIGWEVASAGEQFRVDLLGSVVDGSARARTLTWGGAATPSPKAATIRLMKERWGGAVEWIQVYAGSQNGVTLHDLKAQSTHFLRLHRPQSSAQTIAVSTLPRPPRRPDVVEWMPVPSPKNALPVSADRCARIRLDSASARQ
jgi:hypothetical protein